MNWARILSATPKIRHEKCDAMSLLTERATSTHHHPRQAIQELQPDHLFLLSNDEVELIFTFLPFKVENGDRQCNANVYFGKRHGRVLLMHPNISLVFNDNTRWLFYRALLKRARNIYISCQFVTNLFNLIEKPEYKYLESVKLNVAEATLRDLVTLTGVLEKSPLFSRNVVDLGVPFVSYLIEQLPKLLAACPSLRTIYLKGFSTEDNKTLCSMNEFVGHPSLNSLVLQDFQSSLTTFAHQSGKVWSKVSLLRTSTDYEINAVFQIPAKRELVELDRVFNHLPLNKLHPAVEHLQLHGRNYLSMFSKLHAQHIRDLPNLLSLEIKHAIITPGFITELLRQDGKSEVQRILLLESCHYDDNAIDLMKNLQRQQQEWSIIVQP